jgi:hypothetical protein
MESMALTALPPYVQYIETQAIKPYPYGILQGSAARTGLKIKLNVGAAKLRAGQTVESTPSEGTPSQSTPAAFIPTKSKRTIKKRISGSHSRSLSH